uniref:Uncharacterized protein n=1 Tax=Parascaris univalens TaxID=6257 RepID=A0A915B8F9_PARUN
MERTGQCIYRMQMWRFVHCRNNEKNDECCKIELKKDAKLCIERSNKFSKISLKERNFRAANNLRITTKLLLSKMQTSKQRMTNTTVNLLNNENNRRATQTTLRLTSVYT